MSELDGKEQELIMKHMIRQLMKDQFNELNTDKQENNNSFVYLEKSTLNMVILVSVNERRASDNWRKRRES